MSIRLFVDLPLAALHAGSHFVLPDAAARHAQVRRVQPGDVLSLFDGSGHEWPAEITAMSRSEVAVRLGVPQPVDRELHCEVHLAIGMPANDRMDALVEKLCELGVARVQPLVCERSVLRLAGERAQRKQQHWQAIAVAACEQSGRACVPVVEPVLSFSAWLQLPRAAGTSLLLSPHAGARPLHEVAASATRLCALSGPEGGLAPGEQQAAAAAGFVPTGLGPRVLRADTAPLALLAWLGLHG